MTAFPRFLANYSWHRFALLLALVLGLIYLAICLLLIVFQRTILFEGDDEVVGIPPTNSIFRPQTIVERDGERLLIWRAEPSRTGNPTFVFFPGAGSGTLDFEETGELFHRRGWGVVLAAYRGYSGNAGTPSESGLMADARAVLAGIPKQIGPIIVWGHSLGSGIAARMASEHRADGLVLESPYTSVTDVAAERYPVFPVRWFIEDTFDTSSLLPKIVVPVLIFHGMNDSEIPFHMGQTLARRFGNRAVFVPLRGVGHEPHDADLSNQVAYWLGMNFSHGHK